MIQSEWTLWTIAPVTWGEMRNENEVEASKWERRFNVENIAEHENEIDSTLSIVTNAIDGFSSHFIESLSAWQCLDDQKALSRSK